MKGWKRGKRLLGAMALLGSLVTLQGCCLLFEGPCNYKHKVYNRSGETLACKIVSAHREREVTLEPGEKVTFDYCTELLVIHLGERDAAFPGILGEWIFCPLEITPEKELFVTEPRYREHLKSPLIKPVSLPRNERLYWWDLVGSHLGALAAHQQRLQTWEDPTTGLAWRYLPEGEQAIVDSARPLRFGQEVEVPATLGGLPVRTIGDSAFADSKAKRVILPQGVEVIGRNAFATCHLEEVTLPERLKHIGDGAFSNASLKDLRLPEGLETIGDSAFAWCMDLEHITLPSSVSSLRWKAFGQCARLQSVTFEGAPPAGEGAVFYPIVEHTEVLGRYPSSHAAAWEAVIQDGSWRGLRMQKQGQ